MADDGSTDPQLSDAANLIKSGLWDIDKTINSNSNSKGTISIWQVKSSKRCKEGGGPRGENTQQAGV